MPVSAAATSSPSSEARRFHITRRSLATPRIAVLELVPADGEPAPAWAPGSHIPVTLPSGLIRHYSLCGPRGDRERLTIAVQRSESGPGSAELHELPEGAAVLVDIPRDRFPLVDADRHLFIAGGIGITPFLSMVAELHANGGDYELHYAVKTAADAELATRLPNEHRTHLYHADRGQRLSIADLARSADAGTAVYACGPASLLDEMNTWAFDLRSRGAALHTERFTADAKEGIPDSGGVFSVTLARSGKVIDIAPGQSILDGARAAGCVVPSSCEEGFCGTCETRVIDGIPDHHDDFLTAQERESGETMMICVGRAKSASLTLDL